jgi:serine/threonine protein kinase
MGKAVSGASDQYSVAVMAYRMLCGHVPFDGDSAIDILHKHCMMPPPPLDVLANGLPSHTGWAVNKALSKDPARRFPTVMAFVNALETPSPEIEMSTSATVMNTPAVTTASMAGSAAASATGQKPHTRKSLENMGTQLMDSGDIRKKKQQPPPPKGKGKLVGVAVTVVVLGGAGGWIALQGGGAKSGSGAPTDSVNRTQTQVAAVPPASGSPAGQQTGSATPVQKVPQQTPRNPAGDRAATSNAARNNRPADRSAPPRESAPVVTKPEAPQRGVVQIAVIGGFADVSVDGVSQGTKTRWPDTLPAGRHQILFERAGYISIDTSVVVRAGDTQLLKITLTPRQE